MTAEPSDDDDLLPASFVEAMRRVKDGKTNPGARNRPGCRFPHCACQNPWNACDRPRVPK